MATETYLEKLKDVRWQRKRLAMLERAKWKCECCGNDEKTKPGISLHVHHRWYSKGVEPWDYHDDCYEVLCEDCHTYVEKNLKTKINHLLLAIPSILLSSITYQVSLFKEVQSGDLELAAAEIEAVLRKYNSNRGVPDCA